MYQQPYEKYGISYSPHDAQKDSLLKIEYFGLLAKSGASDVYMRLASENDFSNSKDVKMRKTGDNRFEATIQTGLVDNLNFCFKDSANNWDNNNGNNYSISLY